MRCGQGFMSFFGESLCFFWRSIARIFTFLLNVFLDDCYINLWDTDGSGESVAPVL